MHACLNADIARMVTEKDQSNAAKDVRTVLEKNPGTFSHRVTKARLCARCRERRSQESRAGAGLEIGSSPTAG